MRPPLRWVAAEELLRAQGFTDVRYVERTVDRAPQPLASAPVDFRLTTPWDIAGRIDGGEPITVLGGVHVGCFELFAREGIRNVTDLSRCARPRCHRWRGLTAFLASGTFC